MTRRSIATSPQAYARLAGASYLATIVTGAMAAFSSSGQVVCILIATAAYVVVTLGDMNGPVLLAETDQDAQHGLADQRAFAFRSRSTLRFCARPEARSLLATGCPSP